jgi:hypothetical protein
MFDRLYIQPTEPPLPEQRLPDELKHKWYGDLGPKKLSLDVIRAFDDIHELRKQLRNKSIELLETRRQLERANQKIWIMSLIVSPIIAAIFKALWAKVFP